MPMADRRSSAVARRVGCRVITSEPAIVMPCQSGFDFNQSTVASLPTEALQLPPASMAVRPALATAHNAMV